MAAWLDSSGSALLYVDRAFLKPKCKLCGKTENLIKNAHGYFCNEEKWRSSSL
jgi:hypothetical protein